MAAKKSIIPQSIRSLRFRTKILALISFALYIILMFILLAVTNIRWYYAPIVLTSIISVPIGMSVLFSFLNRNVPQDSK